MSLLGNGIRSLAHAWNIFNANQPELGKTRPYSSDWGSAQYGPRPDRPVQTYSNERSIVSSIFMRLAIDVASVDIRHVRLDDQNRFKEDIDSGLQNILQIEANIDQAATMFRQDAVATLIERGVVALVPINTTINPELGSVDPIDMRVGTVETWHRRHVRVSVYNEETGRREEVTIAKRACAIIENPLYDVMNKPNSTLKRLISKLNMLDAVDKQSSSGKLDLIIQLPYVVKSEARRKDADRRRKDIEVQLKDSQYGVAWTDGTEKITQLNRPVENQLMKQVEWLTEELYGELGLTKDIMLGKASETELLNYWNRTIEPILTAMVEEMRRKFLTKTARSQKQWILYFRDAFKLVPLGGEYGLTKAIDVLSRNEIASPNELRGLFGWQPRPEPHADELRNSNMPKTDNTEPSTTTGDDDLEGALNEFGVEVDSAAA